MEIMNTMVSLYLCIGFAKCVLVISDVGVSSAVAHRVTSTPRWKWVLLMAIGVVLVSFGAWPLALWREGPRFVIAYSRFSVIRQVARTFRDGQAKAPLHRG